MQSGPDQFSDLNGRDLVQKKIKKIIWMDGMYNFGCAEHDTYDWLGDDAGCRGSAKEALESIFGCCSEIEHIFNPVDVGEKVDTGAKLSTCASENNPCRQAYIDWTGGPNRGRHSWDLINTLIAVRGLDALETYLGFDNYDEVQIADSGVETFVDKEQGGIKRVNLKDAQGLADEIDNLLCQEPSA